MTIKLASIKNKIAVESDGDYIDIPDWPGVKLGVKSTESPAFKLAMDNLVMKYSRKYKNKTAPTDVRNADIGELLADHILFDWEGFDEPYSAETAKELLKSEDGRDFVKQVSWAAAQVGQTEIEFLESSAKN